MKKGFALAVLLLCALFVARVAFAQYDESGSPLAHLSSQFLPALSIGALLFVVLWLNRTQSWTLTIYLGALLILLPLLATVFYTAGVHPFSSFTAGHSFMHSIVVASIVGVITILLLYLFVPFLALLSTDVRATQLTVSCIGLIGAVIALSTYWFLMLGALPIVGVIATVYCVLLIVYLYTQYLARVLKLSVAAVTGKLFIGFCYLAAGIILYIGARHIAQLVF